MPATTLTCPNCGRTFEAPEGLDVCFCPACGTKISLTKSAPKPVQMPVVFQDARGFAIGSALVPEGWNLSGTYEEIKIDEITPFGTTATAASPDQTMTLGSRYGEHWYHYLLNGPLQLASPRKQWKKYMEPQDYLQSVAERIAGTKVTPVTGGSLPTAYSLNRNQEATKLVSRFEENAHIQLPNVQCELRLQNVLCEAQALICRYKKNGTDWTVITGADLFGLEYYDAAPMGTLNRKMTNVLRLKGKKKAPEDGSLPEFGHASDYGKPVDAIEWGSKRLYFAVGPTEKEGEVMKNFFIFAGSWTQDVSLNQRLEQAHIAQVQSEQASLRNAMNYAVQSQAMNMQRQAQISQTLSETSNIIMQGYNNRMASQDRISDNWSQAIRGVDSYVTTDGRTVEHSVVSDHVYQNQYGDTIGVSGQLDEVPRDWTEIHKKD